MRHFSNWFGALATVVFLFSCSVSRHTVGRAAKTLLQDSALQQAHIGISIYDVAKGQYLYNYQGDKYFIPASNTKLFTCYAGMQYLGDSLVGIQFAQDDTAVWLLPTGDPTLLHPDFTQHPVLDFLQKEKRQIYLLPGNWREEGLGYGWAWDDYNGEYMVERSPLPVHGNMALYQLRGVDIAADRKAKLQWDISPSFFTTQVDSMVVQPTGLDALTWKNQANRFSLQRKRMGNRLDVQWGGAAFTKAEIPVYTDTVNTALAVLKHGYLPTIKKGQWNVDQVLRLTPGLVQTFQSIKSQPTDSMLKPMMHRSDNFYAE
jgi:serine-type D-Ala-D-Ala carboxypeptidase/endopeptidase (penicillin-binding protein 4)